MKKVALLLNSLNGAGAQKTLLTLAEKLFGKGISVDCYIVHENKNDYKVRDGIGVIYMKGANEAQKCVFLNERTSGCDYDLFITCQPEYYSAAVAGKKYCSVHHTPGSWNDRPFWKFLEQRKYMQRDREYYQGKNLIALSDGIKQDLVENLHCKPQSIKVINNPFDISAIRDKAENNQNIPDFPYVIYVASLSERKRHEDLFRAFARIRNGEIKLVLVGKGSNERRLKKLAAKLGITERIIFWGWDANPYRLVKNARLAVLASRAEGLPRVVVEAMALRTPVVSTDCRSGPREVLTGQFERFLVPVGGVAAMADAINRALENYPEIPDDFVARFDGDYIAEQYVGLIPDEN